MRQSEQLYNEYLKELYTQQSRGMIRYANAVFHDQYRAEEAVQETFAVAWQKIESLIASPSPVGWLFVTLKNIMKHMLAEHYQMKKRIVSLEECSHDTLNVSDEFNIVTQLEGVVSKEEFEIIEKLYLRGYTYKELAEELEIPPSTVGMRAKRTKEKIKKDLKKFF